MRYVAVRSWQIRKNIQRINSTEERSYLEESHHAVQYIADNFGVDQNKIDLVHLQKQRKQHLNPH